MKKWMKMLGCMVAAVVLCFSIKTGAKAVQVTGVEQTKGETDRIGFICKEVADAFRYEYSLTESVSDTVVKKDFCYAPKGEVLSLSSGKTYLLKITAYGRSGIVATASDPIEVTTAPSTSGYSVSQASATANSITIMAAGANDANFYVVRFVGSEEVVAYSDSTSITVKGLTPNTEYNFNVFAARKSAAGFIAEGSFKSCTAKTRDINGDDLKTPSSSDFGISQKSLKDDSYTFFVNGTALSNGYELEFQDMKGKVQKKEKTTSMNPTIVKNFINGKFYKYHVRTYVKYGTTEMFSKWSAFKYLGVMTKASATKQKKAMTLKWNAVNGASNYIVYASTNEKSGFKKLKSVKGKSLKVTKVGGKALKKGTKYYFRIEVWAKDGKKAVKSSSSYSFSQKF